MEPARRRPRRAALSTTASRSTNLISDIRTVAGDRAVLLISHRYGNLHLAGRIVVLQDGRVVDQGTHDELIARSGLYAQLYGLQARSYRAT